MLEISNVQARRVVLHLQGLDFVDTATCTDSKVRKTIQRMGFVQVDSICWVERAQHMILFSRNPAYQPSQLHRMIEKKRWLFEGFTHDASIIPTELFQYWRHRFRRDQDRLRKGYSKWQGNGFVNHLESLVQRIRESGPVRSRDLRQSVSASGEMWQWSDEKTALEYLWRTGRLAIAARERFEKVYDLTERVIPDEHHGAECSESDFVDWACRSALERLGMGTASDIAGFWKAVSIAEVRDWIRRNPDSVCQVSVQSVDGQRPRKMYARADIETVTSDSTKLPLRMRVMSPFDPVIRDRKRLEWMFGFQYRIEIYVPEAKRKYGYYVFPLLDGERIIGRVDMRADRSENKLAVKKVWWESGVQPSKAMLGRLERELSRQAKFAGVNR